MPGCSTPKPKIGKKCHFLKILLFRSLQFCVKMHLIFVRVLAPPLMQKVVQNAKTCIQYNCKYTTIQAENRNKITQVGSRSHRNISFHLIKRREIEWRFNNSVKRFDNGCAMRKKIKLYDYSKICKRFGCTNELQIWNGVIDYSFSPIVVPIRNLHFWSRQFTL